MSVPSSIHRVRRTKKTLERQRVSKAKESIEARRQERLERHAMEAKLSNAKTTEARLRIKRSYPWSPKNPEGHRETAIDYHPVDSVLVYFCTFCRALTGKKRQEYCPKCGQRYLPQWYDEIVYGQYTDSEEENT